jgi:hypothetical protein
MKENARPIYACYWLKSMKFDSEQHLYNLLEMDHALGAAIGHTFEEVVHTAGANMCN